MTPNTFRILLIEQVKAEALKAGIAKLSGYQIAKASLAIEQGDHDPASVFAAIRDLR